MHYDTVFPALSQQGPLGRRLLPVLGALQSVLSATPMLSLLLALLAVAKTAAALTSKAQLGLETYKA